MRYSRPQWSSDQSLTDLRNLLFNNSLSFLGDFAFLTNDDVSDQLPLGIPICGFFTKQKVWTFIDIMEKGKG
jgi:hypothetical protein